MGCQHSDIESSQASNRSKMLLEYLKGVEKIEQKEVKAPANGKYYLNEFNDHGSGEIFIAEDSSRFNIIGKTDGETRMLCVCCNEVVMEKNIKKHLKLMSHLHRLRP